MPTYDYECKSCDHKFEAFHAMSAEPLVECPECHKPKLIKLVSGGAAVIVRGTKTPCRGNRGGATKKKQRMKPKAADKLGMGKNKGELPPWRDGPIDKRVLKNPDEYIQKGEIS